MNEAIEIFVVWTLGTIYIVAILVLATWLVSELISEVEKWISEKLSD